MAAQNAFSCRTIACLALLACLSSAPAVRAEPAFIVGVGTHLMNLDIPLQKPLMLTAEAGFNSVRDDIF